MQYRGEFAASKLQRIRIMCVKALTKITSVTDLLHPWQSMAHMHLDTVLELNSTAIQLPFFTQEKSLQ